jgi:hypothetical protein
MVAAPRPELPPVTMKMLFLISMPLRWVVL